MITQPKNILFYIAKYLKIYDHLQLRATCKKMYVLSEFIYKEHEFQLNSESQLDFAAKFNKLRINFNSRHIHSKYSWRTRILYAAPMTCLCCLPAFEALEELHIQKICNNCPKMPNLVKLITEQTGNINNWPNLFPELKYLSLGRIFNEKLVYFPKLETLILGENFNKDIDIIGSQIKKLKLGYSFDKNIDYLAGKMPNLTSLSIKNNIGQKFINSCNLISLSTRAEISYPKFLKKLSTNMPNKIVLPELETLKFKCFTNKHVVHQLPKLKKLLFYPSDKSCFQDNSAVYPTVQKIICKMPVVVSETIFPGLKVVKNKPPCFINTITNEEKLHSIFVKDYPEKVYSAEHIKTSIKPSIFINYAKFFPSMQKITFVGFKKKIGNQYYGIGAKYITTECLKLFAELGCDLELI